MHAIFTILHHDTDYYFSWVSKSFDPNVAARARTPPATSEDAYCLVGTTTFSTQRVERLRQQIDSAAQLISFTPGTSIAGAPPLVEGGSRTFTGLGKLLFAQLIPEPIQQQIRILPTGSILQLITNDITLPWELLHDGDEFLALKHTIARLPYLQRLQRQHNVGARSTKVSCLLLGNPTSDLAGTVQEIKAIEDVLFVARERVTYRSLFGDHISADYLCDLLATEHYDIIHYAGHATPDALLLTGEPLGVDRIHTALHNHPIVVLNACATADSSTAISDLATFAHHAQSLATAFVQAGATAVIGMLWPIPDQTAKLFGQVLYQQLTTGETIGTALRLSRRVLRQQDPQGLSWLAPVLYGNPWQQPIPMTLNVAIGTVLAIHFPASPVDYHQIKAPKPQDYAHYLALLTQCIVQHGGFVFTTTQAGLLATFGLYDTNDSNAITAILAARAILAQLAAWQVPPPAIAIVSGELAATSLSHTINSVQAVASPFLVGAAVLEAQELLASAAPGQILINELVRERCKNRFHCQPWQNPRQSVSQVQAFELISTPIEIAAGRLALDLSVTVGRDTERAQLMAAWQAVAAGHGQVIGISGEAGIGKTHLLQTFRQRIEVETAQWLQVECTLNIQNTPYGLLARLFRTLLGISDYLAEAQIQELLRIHFTDHSSTDLALLAEILGMQQPNLQRQEQAVYQHQLYRFLVHLLLQRIARMPLILVLEDAHWSDAASLEVLTLLANQLDEAPILLCLVYRSDWQPLWVGKTFFQSIQLRAMSSLERQQLYREILDTAQLPDELVALVNRSSGNPLFLTEILITLLHKGLLTPQTGSDTVWQITGMLQARDLPDSIQRVIDMRLGQLEKNTQEVLSMAAIFSGDFTLKMLQWGLALAEAQLYEQLQILSERDFLRRSLGSDRYTFRHDLIRDVTYLKIPMAQRQLWHHQVAVALEEQKRLGRESVTTLAHHYYQSLVDDSTMEPPTLNREADPVKIEKALVYLLKSGRDALDHYGSQEAVTLFQRAASVASLALDKLEQQVQIYTGLGDAYQLNSEYPLAKRAYQAAQGALHMRPLTMETRLQVAEVARLLARLHMWQAEYIEAEAWIQTGLESVQAFTVDACRSAVALLYIQAGAICFNRGNYELAIEQGQRGLTIAQEYKLDDAIAESNFILGAIMRSTGSYDLALSHYNTSLALYEKQQNLYQIHRVRMNIGLALFNKGAWSHALSHYKQVLQFWETIGEQNLQAGMYINMGLAEQYLGHSSRALDYFTNALAICQKIKNEKWTALAYSNLGALHVAQESWQLARMYLLDSLRVLEEHSIDAYQADVTSHLALVELAEGHVDTALTLAYQAVELATANQAKQHHAIALRTLGRIFMAKEDLAQAFAHLEQSQKILESLGERYELARTSCQLALAKTIAGERSAATLLCTNAIHIFQDLNAVKDLEQAQHLYKQLHGEYETVSKSQTTQEVGMST